MRVEGIAERREQRDPTSHDHRIPDLRQGSVQRTAGALLINAAVRTRFAGEIVRRTNVLAAEATILNLHYHVQAGLLRRVERALHEREVIVAARRLELTPAHPQSEAF